MAESQHLIDDRSSGAPARWRFFSDGVMGGLSSGAIADEVVLGRPALCLRGRVRLENNGGFIQMALDLTPPPGDWRALEFDLAGRTHDYGVHLRTAGLTAPWQAWRARIAVTPQWQTLRVPFTAFEPYRFSGTLVPGEIRRLGLVALGEAFDAELCLARVAWVR
jgi:Complex I intermediate-associated protein 30 (CIA30)